jgi:hypothetical protein
LHLSDGIYTSFTDLALEEPLIPPSKPFKATPHAPQPTSTFDALMRLSNLDDCIQDALSVREKLSSQITTLIQDQHSTTSLPTSADAATSSLESTNRALTTARHTLQAAQKRRSALQASLAARRAAIISGTLTQEKATSHLLSAPSSLASRSPSLEATKTATRTQIRRIATDLLHVYPLTPLPPKPLHFTIASLPLPPASHLPTTSSPSLDALAAALGHAAHLTHLLSHYLSTPLPYPLTPHGSTSTVYDPIASTLRSRAARTFPLYARGAAGFRFEYGVLLLNKDVEALLEGEGGRLVDVRCTAGNLRLLMSVLVGGEGGAEVERGGWRVEGEGDGGAVEGKGKTVEEDYGD